MECQTSCARDAYEEWPALPYDVGYTIRFDMVNDVAIGSARVDASASWACHIEQEPEYELPASDVIDIFLSSSVSIYHPIHYAMF